METKNTSITFVIGLREAQSLLMLMRAIDKKPSPRAIRIDCLAAGNFRDFSDIRYELERLLLMDRS